MKIHNEHDILNVNPFELILQKLEVIVRKLNEPVCADGPKKKDLIDRIELRRRLCVSDPTIIRWERRKKIPVIRLGRSVRYDWDDVVEHLKRSA